MAEPTTSSELPSPGVRWQQMFPGNERMKQITAIENAAMNSINCLRHMRSTLVAQSDTRLARICELWQTRIDGVLSLPDKNRVVVGVRGVTGSGKSTMINAILGIKGLLPTNPSKACTAVPVEVSYNRSEDSKEQFRAEVQFATKEEWKKELDDLFIDVHDHLHADKESGADQDHERKERINDALSKLKYVYPHLKSVEDLGATSATKLLEDKNVKKVLNSKRIIQKATLKQFSAAILLYIATQESDRKDFVHWPLVTCVKLFVKAEVLRSGLVLVDLPGGMDSNAARSSIAEKYQKKLAVTCMVVDNRRGIDDRNAHDLMEELLKRDMQMDGIYDSDHLCFVLSQCDRDYDVPNYWRQNPTLFFTLQRHFDEWKESQTLIEKREGEYRKLQKDHKENRDAAKNIEDEIGELQSQHGLSQPATKLKRKRGQNDGCITTQWSGAQARIVELEKSLSNLNEAEGVMNKEELALTNRLKDLKIGLHFREGKIVQECNNYKNEKSIAAVRRDFENTRKEMGCASTNPLQVFCVSANTYLGYRAKTGVKKLGFPNPSDTQIPMLRDWLVGFTYDGRENTARSIITGTELLIATMMPWIEDRQGNTKLSDIDRAQAGSVLDGMVIELDQKISELCLDVTTSINGLVHDKIYSRMPRVEKLAGIASQATIIELGKKKENLNKNLAWNTYCAINRRRGLWVELKKKRDYKWNDQLFLDYTNHLVQDWNKVFYSAEGIAENISAYTNKAEHLLKSFMSDATGIEDHLDISMKLQLEDQLSKSSSIMQFKTNNIFENIKLAVRESHREVASPAIMDYLTPVYNACSAEKGAGSLKRSQDRHLENMKENSIKMHRKASFAITEALDRMLQDLRTQLSGSHREMIEQVRNVIEIFLEENSATNSKYPTRKVFSQTKASLQNSLEQDISGLGLAWKEKLIFEPEEREDLSSMEYEQDDKYHLREEDPKDEDYVDDDGY